MKDPPHCYGPLIMMVCNELWVSKFKKLFIKIFFQLTFLHCVEENVGPFLKNNSYNDSKWSHLCFRE